MSGGVVSGRDELVEALRDALGWDWPGESFAAPIIGCDTRVPSGREACEQVADALLASGAVREEAAVRAEALREAADALDAQFSHRSGPAVAGSGWLRGRAEKVTSECGDCRIVHAPDPCPLDDAARAALAPQDPA